MAKYTVYIVYDATEFVEVEADTAEEARDKAEELAQAHLCHQCANHLDLGDITNSIVIDEDGNEVQP